MAARFGNTTWPLTHPYTQEFRSDNSIPLPGTGSGSYLDEAGYQAKTPCRCCQRTCLVCSALQPIFNSGPEQQRTLQHPSYPDFSFSAPISGADRYQDLSAYDQGHLATFDTTFNLPCNLVPTAFCTSTATTSEISATTRNVDSGSCGTNTPSVHMALTPGCQAEHMLSSGGQVHDLHERRNGDTGGKKRHTYCIECGRDFKTTSNYNKHRKDVHEKVRYMCTAEECKKTFSRNSYRQKHENKFHPDHIKL